MILTLFSCARRRYAVTIINKAIIRRSSPILIHSTQFSLQTRYISVKNLNKNLLFVPTAEVQFRRTTINKRNMSSADVDWKSKETVYDFSAKDIDGNEVSMDKYKGHPLLIVNVATNCGLTKANYKQLNELYDQFEKDGLRIAAFPCNQFAGQEPGCEVEIKEFIKKNGVRFDMYSKIDVNGDSAHPMYKWLKSKQGGFLGFDGIKWNFTKFLIDKEGAPIKRYAPTVEPKNIEPDISALL